MNDADLYERKLESLPTPTLVSDTEAHAKLKRNLAKALDCHDDILSGEFVTSGIPGGDKRLMLEAANATVKAALTTDRTALKAREGNTLARVFLRVLFHRKRLGHDLSREDVKRLKTAPRTELEASLSPRELAVYDQMFSAIEDHGRGPLGLD